MSAPNIPDECTEIAFPRQWLCGVCNTFASGPCFLMDCRLGSDPIDQAVDRHADRDGLANDFLRLHATGDTHD
jgi:hypothetical protein